MQHIIIGNKQIELVMVINIEGLPAILHCPHCHGRVGSHKDTGKQRSDGVVIVSYKDMVGRHGSPIA
jgi:hypothetical protein